MRGSVGGVQWGREGYTGVFGPAREHAERREQAKGIWVASGRARVPELATAQLEPSGLTWLWVPPTGFVMQT